MAKQKGPKGSKVWAGAAVVSGLVATNLSKQVLDKGWRAATGRKPPSNPADPDVALIEAVAWSVVTGSVIALTKMMAQRRAANYYVKSTGHLPPQLEKDGK